MLLTGAPKTAVWKLSGPMMAAMLLMSLCNLVNAIWVAGLGPDALAVVGFMTLLYMRPDNQEDNENLSRWMFPGRTVIPVIRYSDGVGVIINPDR